MSRRAAFCLVMWLLMAQTGEAATSVGGALPIAQAIGQAGARQRDLLAEAGEDHFWIARVGWDAAANSTETLIVYRGKWSGNADWTAFPPIPDRVVSMATSNGELLLVLANGQWEIADDTDIRSGPTGPMWDSMLAVAAGGDTVWAVVRGSAAATQESATTNASTEPSTQGDGETRLMICQLDTGKWTKLQTLPDGLGDDPAQMSLTVAGGLPMLAWRTPGGGVSVSELSAQGEWSKPVAVGFGPGPIDFKLLTINNRGVLWAAPAPPASRPANEPVVATVGEVLIGDDFSKRISLIAAATLPGDIGSQTLVAAFGNLRWIAYSGDKQIEQDYSLDAFPQSFPAAKMSVVPSPKPPVIPLTPWIGGDGVLVLLAVLAAIRQRNVPSPEMKEASREAKPGLAPLGVRFVAGVVDLAPMLAVVAILHPANSGNPLTGIDAKSLNVLGWAALATYVVHTLAAELICGQSLGKIVFGLRVMRMDGKPPTTGQIVTRNLLRVVDVTLMLPLVIVLITPLRQRVGDLAAGTVVIGGVGGEEEENGKE